MECISEDRYIDIDRSENKSSLAELQTDFKRTYKEIEQYKADPSCDAYHRLYDKLWDLYDKIANYVPG